MTKKIFLQKFFLGKIFFFLCFPLVSIAQDSQEIFSSDSTYIKPSLQFGVEKFLDIYRFLGNADYFAESPFGKIVVRQQYLGRANQSTATNFSDNENFLLNYSSPRFSDFRIVAHNKLLFSNDIGGVSSIGRLLGGAGIEYFPAQNSTMLLSSGIESNAQLDSTLHGPFVNFSSRIKNFSFEEYELNFFGGGRYLSLNSGERVNSDIHAEATINKNFELGERLNFFVNYRQIGRDNLFSFAQGADRNFFSTEHRNEERFSVGSNFIFSLINPLFINFDLRYDALGIERNYKQDVPNQPQTKIQRSSSETNFSISGLLLYEKENFLQQIGLSYRTSDLANSTAKFHGISDFELQRLTRENFQRDQTVQQTNFLAQTIWRISKRDTLNINASALIVRQDAPSPERFDDYDRLTLAGDMQYGRNFSHVLSFSVLAGLNTSHQVNLESGRSGENNWEYRIRLIPSFTINSRYFGMRPRFEISANYISYDYEQRGVSPQSFSAREISYRDSILIPLVRNVRLESSLAFRFMQQSIFQPKLFAESPLNERNEQFAKLLIFTRSDFAEIGVGGRIFSLIQKYFFEYPAIISGYNNQLTFGPETTINIFFQNGSQLIFNGWYEFQFLEKILTRKIPNLTLQAKIAM